jgi:SNF2 family DNA or RNA helicase
MIPRNPWLAVGEDPATEVASSPDAEEDDGDLCPSPLSRTIIMQSQRRAAQRHGYGWFKCVQTDARLASARLASALLQQKAIRAGASDTDSRRRVAASPLQRAMGYYNSAEERQRFLHARPLTTLWSHQALGVDFMRRREREGAPAGGIIAYEMRAGKTLMIVAAVLEELQAHVRAGGRRFGQPTLFLAPPQAIQTIADQIEQHFGPAETRALNVAVLSTQRPFVAQMNWAQELLGSYDLIVTSYSLLTASYHRRFGGGGDDGSDGSDLPFDALAPELTLLDLKYRRVVADEAHVFCNQDTQLFRAVMTLDAQFRWFVTGTPIRNAAEDLLSPLAFLRVPRPLPPLESAEMRALLARIMIRRIETPRPSSGGDDLVVRLSFATAVERRFYEDAQAHTRLLLRGRALRKAQQITLILRLRQLCADPHLLSSVASASLRDKYVFERYGADTWSAESCLQDMLMKEALDPNCALADPRRKLVDACPPERLASIFERLVPLVATKVEYILDYYDRCIAGTDEKLVIFSSWANFLERIGSIFEARANLKHASSPHLIVHGKTSYRDRDAHFAAFNSDPGRSVLMLTFGTGGVSLDLTRANHVIIADLWFNPYTEEQALARLRGVNQKRPVHIRRLCIRDTVDEKILLLAEKKRGLSRLLQSTPDERQEDDAPAVIPADSMALLVAWILGQKTAAGARPSLKRKREDEDAG